MKKKNGLPVEYVSLSSEDVQKEKRKASRISLPTLKIKKIRINRDVLSAAALVAACLYVVFLIVGIVKTQYYEDTDNVRHAVVADYSMLKTRDDYLLIKKDFQEIRSLFVDIYIIDMKLSNGTLKNFDAGILYKKILDEKVDVIIPKLSALDVAAEQGIIKQALINIVSNDIAVYLQKIIQSISGNDQAALEEALHWHEKMFESYKNLEIEVERLREKVRSKDASYLDWNFEEEILKKDPLAAPKQNNGG